MRQTVQSVTQGKIEFEKEIDPDILGGFVLNVETYQLDASLKSQLQTIKNDLLSRNAAEA
jgi:F-type H+-transporting ATPase subunit delta